MAFSCTDMPVEDCAKPERPLGWKALQLFDKSRGILAETKFHVSKREYWITMDIFHNGSP